MRDLTSAESPALSVALRAARPTREEALVCARLFDQLSPGFRKAFGRDTVGVLAEAYMAPGHALSYEHISCAEHDGAVVGMISCYTAPEHRVSTAGALRRALRVHGLRRIAASALARFVRRFGPEGEDEYYVWALVVAEQVRRHGVGARLMELAEAGARERGLTRLTTDVEPGNHGARRLYERCGMMIVSRWPSLPLIPPLAYRMTKAL